MSGIYESGGRVLLVGGGVAVPPPAPPPPATTGIPAYLQNLPNGKMLSGQATDFYDSNSTTPWASFSSGSSTAQNANVNGYYVSVVSIMVQGPANSGSGTQQGNAVPNDFVTLANGIIASGAIPLVGCLLNNPAGPYPLDTTGKDGGSVLTNPFQAGNNCLTAGTTANTNLNSNLAAIAALLAKVRGNVIFRPLPECNGNWLWWGWGSSYASIGGGSGITPAQYIALWIYIYDYMTVTAGLTNLFWCYNVNDQSPGPAEGVPYLAGYPGTQYVDIVAMDSYSDTPGTLAASSNGCLSALSSTGKPVGMCELGNGTFTTPDGTSYETILADIKANAPAIKFITVFCQGWKLAGNSGATAFMTDSAIINRPSLPAGICHTVPAQAAAVGFNTCTWDNTVLNNGSGSWRRMTFYGQSPTEYFTNTQNADGSISMVGGGYSGGDLATAVKASGGVDWNGVAFSGGAYFEAVMSFTGQTDYGSGQLPNGGPAFWALDVEHSSQGPYLVNWPGSTAPNWSSTTTYSIGQVVQYEGYQFVSGINSNLGNTPPSIYGGVDSPGASPAWKHVNDFFEVDFMEFGGFGGNKQQYWYQFGIGNWYGNPTLSTGNPTNQSGTSVGSLYVPAGTDFSQPHKYGCLWVPATGSGQTTITQGFLQNYFDDVPLGPQFNWDYHDPTQTSSYPNTPPVNGSTAMSGMDWRHMFLIMGSDVNQPTEAYSVRVWQLSAAKNLVI